MSDGISLHGFCDDRFAEVRTEFERNFAERGEVGAAVAIRLDGKPVVDLWGGTADTTTRQAWHEDTIVTVFSSTKGMAAVCLHMLADRKVIDFDAPVARYWPEFAARGKQAITVAMILSHQAGLPYWEEPLPHGALLDWDLAVGRLAEQQPAWEPGTCHGYHGITIGFLMGEIVRRVTGRTIGTYFREEVAGPLGIDAWIGLPESEEARVAPVYVADPDPNSPFLRRMLADPGWPGAKMRNAGGHMTPEMINSRARRAAEIPAGGGITNARGLATLYAPLSLDGSLDGVRLVGAEALPAMRVTRSASSSDMILLIPTTFTLGFSKTWGARSLGPGEHVVIGEHAFGAPGLGGNMGFADGDARLSFGYTMNRHGTGTGLNDRGQSLIDAAYRAIGFSSSASGCWVR